MPPWFDELSEFLRIPSVSADPAHAGDVVAAGGWVCDLIRDAGGSAELVDWHGQPLAIGELRASGDPEHAPTVLCYGHFDVQPPDPLELWESAPFEPEIRGEYLYGRGVADDKGQLYLLLSAARELARAGELPVNVRFTCDGEEETGGNSILEYLAADDRGADVAVIFDTGMVARGVPAFNVATRGLVYFHLSLRTGARDLHSGIYGGAAMNAVHALVRTLSAVTARDGRLAEALRAGIHPPTQAELDGWRELPDGVGELAGQDAQPADARAAEEFYIRTFAEPALDINGFDAGSPYLQKTVLPVKADANVSIRLAPGQDPTPSPPRSSGSCATQRPTAPSSMSSGGRRPLRSRRSRRACDHARSRRVRARVWGPTAADPVRRDFADRAGVGDHGIPAIITGFSLPDANIHSPNERMLVEYIGLGLAASKALLVEFAAL